MLNKVETWQNTYTSNAYLENHPTWHTEDSSWKAAQIARIMAANGITPKTVYEVGCGAGEILRQLQMRFPDDCYFRGYEISPQAIQLCQGRANERLQFRLADFREETDVSVDVVLVIDVIEHLEDYFGFLRDIKLKARYKIFHIPLDLSAQAVLRGSPLTGARESAGHIHYFSKDLALRTLEEVGYTIRDYFYTASAIDLPTTSLKTRLAKLPRRTLFRCSQDLAARVLGGYSLLVLAE